MPHYELSLNGFRCAAKIGWTEPERREAQPVLFDLTFRFPDLPAACVSDDLAETVCYADVAERLSALCRARDFRLVEHLAFEAFGQVRERLPCGVALALRATKERAPVPGLTGGASFRIGDWV